MSIFYNQYLHIPYLQPFRFVKRAYADENFWKDDISSLETETCYKQIFNATDTLSFQIKLKQSVISLFVEPQIHLIDCNGNIMLNFNRSDYIY